MKTIHINPNFIISITHHHNGLRDEDTVISHSPCTVVETPNIKYVLKDIIETTKFKENDFYTINHDELIEKIPDF